MCFYLTQVALYTSDLSILGNKGGLDDEKGQSKLFYEYARILGHVCQLYETNDHPVWFLLENVASMSIKDRAKITDTVGINPSEIDSAKVTGVHRKRLYWHNIPIFSALVLNQSWKEILSQDGQVLFSQGNCITGHNSTMVYKKHSFEYYKNNVRHYKRYIYLNIFIQIYNNPCVCVCVCVRLLFQLSTHSFIYTFLSCFKDIILSK